MQVESRQVQFKLGQNGLATSPFIFCTWWGLGVSYSTKPSEMASQFADAVKWGRTPWWHPQLSLSGLRKQSYQAHLDVLQTRTAWHLMRAELTKVHKYAVIHHAQTMSGMPHQLKSVNMLVLLIFQIGEQIGSLKTIVMAQLLTYANETNQKTEK